MFLQGVAGIYSPLAKDGVAWNTNLDHVEWLVGSCGLCRDPAWIMERESSLAQASILASLVHVG
jgi:hypothetical protein